MEKLNRKAFIKLTFNLFINRFGMKILLKYFNLKA